MRALLFIALGLAAGSPAAGADEDAMFGGAAATPSASADAQQLDAGEAAKDNFKSGEQKEDPLQIGGVFYQQLNHRGASEGDNTLSMPLQLDVFLDARPNDRIRANTSFRMLYDSTKDSYGFSNSAPSGTGLPRAVTLAAAPLPNNPQFVLDQAWLKFDIGHAVFVTAGKQHVKWGSGKIWNPSDALNPARRDPLQPYDLRLGSSMIKFDAPLSSVKGNLSAAALLDNPVPAGSAKQIGGAFRAEAVILGAEFGADAAFRDGLAPVYGFDISSGLGPFDAYAEAAILSGSHSYPVADAIPNSGTPIANLFHMAGIEGHALQGVAGLNYSFNYMPNRRASLGAEYFYNELGVSAGMYPILNFFGQLQPFYAGRHYAAIIVNLEGPDASNKSSWNLSTIENISDESLVSRLDFSWKMLEYLTFGAFGDLHYGMPGGEFNYTLQTPALTYDTGSGTRAIAPIYIPLQPYDLGLSLRVSY